MEPTTSYNPEIISLAREARAMSQKDLSARLGKTQGYLSQVEAGLKPPTDDFMHALATELGFPLEFFKEQSRVYGASVSELYHRKRAAAPARALSQIHAWLNIIRMHVERLLRAADLPAPRIPRHDIEDFKSVQEIARVVRAEWQIRPGPFPDLIGAIEDAGAIVVRLSVPTRHVDAISWWVAGLPPLIFVNKDIPADKERWSVAHELGHLVMHRVARPAMEDEADEFTAELLMPQFDVTPYLDDISSLYRLQSLKLHWKVSMAALLRRAKELGRITADQYRRTVIHMSSLGYRTREPADADFAKEQPSVLQELIELHLGELGFTTEQFASHLRASPHDLRNLYRAVMPGWDDVPREAERGLRLVKR